MRHFVIIPFLLIAFNLLSGQTPLSKSDSLQKAFSMISPDNYPEQAKILRQLYDIYLIDNLPAALSVAKRQIVLAEKNNDLKGKGEAATWMGSVYYSQGKNDSS